MADDIKVTAGGTSDPAVATNDKGGRHVQIVQLDLGNDSTISVAENSLPINDGGGSITVDGAVNVSSVPLAANAATETSLQEVSNFLRQLVQSSTSPTGFDRSLGRSRVTAVVESGTVTTVSTVNTVNTVTAVTAVTTVSGLTNIDGRNGAMLINQTNLSAWADCVRARIT